MEISKEISSGEWKEAYLNTKKILDIQNKEVARLTAIVNVLGSEKPKQRFEFDDKTMEQDRKAMKILAIIIGSLFFGSLIILYTITKFI